MEKLKTLKTQVSGNPKPDAAIGDSPQKRFSFFLSPLASSSKRLMSFLI